MTPAVAPIALLPVVVEQKVEPKSLTRIQKQQNDLLSAVKSSASKSKSKIKVDLDMNSGLIRSKTEELSKPRALRPVVRTPIRSSVRVQTSKLLAMKNASNTLIKSTKTVAVMLKVNKFETVESKSYGNLMTPGLKAAKALKKVTMKREVMREDEDDLEYNPLETKADFESEILPNASSDSEEEEDDVEESNSPITTPTPVLDKVQKPITGIPNIKNSVVTVGSPLRKVVKRNDDLEIPFKRKRLLSMEVEDLFVFNEELDGSMALSVQSVNDIFDEIIHAHSDNENNENVDKHLDEESAPRKKVKLDKLIYQSWLDKSLSNASKKLFYGF